MKVASHANQYVSLINAKASSRALSPAKERPAVTFSRQLGASGKQIAAELAVWLNQQAAGTPPWTVMDRDLVERVIEQHKLPKEVAAFMPEDRVSAIQDAVEEMLGLHPSSRLLWQQTAETLRHLAEFGYVILVGRGGNVITRDMPQVFRVRVVAPLDLRVRRIREQFQMDEKAALEMIRNTDRGRKRYVKDHYHSDIDDPLEYDLVLNSARWSPQAAAQWIGEAVMTRNKTLQ